MKKLVESKTWIKDFSYRKYVNAIWYIESRNRYFIKNWTSALGKYQFMSSTLKGYWVSPTEFIKNPVLQEEIMAKYTKKQFETIINILNKNWIKLTKAEDLVFYLAKAHLWWAGAILKNRSDGNLTQNQYAQKATNIYSNQA